MLGLCQYKHGGRENYKMRITNSNSTLFSCFKEEVIEAVSAKYQQSAVRDEHNECFLTDAELDYAFLPNKISYFLPREKHFLESQSNLQGEKG